MYDDFWMAGNRVFIHRPPHGDLSESGLGIVTEAGEVIFRRTERHIADRGQNGCARRRMSHRFRWSIKHGTCDLGFSDESDVACEGYIATPRTLMNLVKNAMTSKLETLSAKTRTIKDLTGLYSDRGRVAIVMEDDKFLGLVHALRPALVFTVAHAEASDPFASEVDSDFYQR